MLEIGINSKCECGKNFKESLKNVKKANIKNIMYDFRNGNDEKNIKTILKLGLRIPFAHLYYRYANDLWAKGEANREYIEDVQNQIRLCSKYNIPLAVMHATNGEASMLALPPSEHALNSMLEILKTAEEYNVKIALENLDAPNFDRFTFLLDNIKSPYLGLCYDAGHHNLYKAEFDILKTYGDRILAIHLHDNFMDWEYGYDYTRDMHLIPFDGKIDYNNVINNIANTNYNNVVMFELHKISSGYPKLYEDISDMKFLQIAKERAEKIAKAIENLRNKK